MAKKKKVPEIRRILGIFDGILDLLFRKMDKAGLSEEDLHRLATPEGELVLDKLVEFMAAQFGKATDIFPITVDYGLSLKEMAEAGKYDWVSDDIFSFRFIKDSPASCKGQGEVQLELLCFGEYLSTKAVLKRLDEMGYRSATFAELCTFGARYPEKQKEFPTIVALGSILRSPCSNCYVACLHWVGSERRLLLHWIDRIWDNCSCFLVVRE